MNAALDDGDRFELAALPPHHQLVERGEIGLGRGDQRVGIGALGGHRAAVLRQPHRDFRLRVGAFGHGVHLIKLQHRLVRHHRLDAVEDGVDRAVALALLDQRLAVDVELHGGALRPVGAGDDRERDQLDVILGGRDLLVDQRLDVLVVDVLLAVGQRLEAHEGVFELIAGELVAQLLELVHEGVPPGMLAHDQRGLLHADVLGHHDLVGLRVLEHAVLVDAALMGEGVTADDRLVVLHRERGDGRDQLRRPRQHLGVDAGPERHHVVAHPHRHHHLFERGVAGALADAVDGALDLAGAGAHAGERIRHRHAEIVMAMHGKARLVGIRHALAHAS